MHNNGRMRQLLAALTRAIKLKRHLAHACAEAPALDDRASPLVRRLPARLHIRAETHIWTHTRAHAHKVCAHTPDKACAHTPLTQARVSQAVIASVLAYIDGVMPENVFSNVFHFISIVSMVVRAVPSSRPAP